MFAQVLEIFSFPGHLLLALAVLVETCKKCISKGPHADRDNEVASGAEILYSWNPLDMNGILYSWNALNTFEMESSR